jgi:hypothetical protein
MLASVFSIVFVFVDIMRFLNKPSHHRSAERACSRKFVALLRHTHALIALNAASTESTGVRGSASVNRRYSGRHNFTSRPLHGSRLTD